MPNQHWLTLGASTLIAGTLLSVAFTSAKPIAIVAASTAGTIAGTLLTRSQKSSSSKLAAREASNVQVSDSLMRLENLLIDNKAELIVLKKQIYELRSSLIQSPSAIYSDQNEQSLIAEIENVPKQDTEKASKIIDLLKAHNLAVESYKEPQEADALFDKVAMALGQQYSVLKTFHRQIKFNISRGGRFSLRLNERSKEDINKITSFCKLLSDRSFLPCRYLSSQKTIIAEPPTHPNMINFFTGDWFESFVYQQVCKFLLENSLEYTSLRQITGTFANGRNFELDILFLIENQPLWIECKAGRDYNEYLTRYTKLRERLRIPKEKSFLVIADLSKEQAVDYTSLWGITVASIDNFIELISNALGVAKNQEQQQQNSKELKTAEIQKIGQNELLKFLAKKSLHPYPEYRKVIIDGLIEVFRSLNQLITINQIKDRLSENTKISKSKINDILRALLYSKCFLDRAGESIPSYTTSISSLLCLDPTILEQKCIETYASAILAVNPNYFNDARNRQEFQETTGTEVPDIEVIKRLLEKEEVEPTEGE